MVLSLTPYQQEALNWLRDYRAASGQRRQNLEQHYEALHVVAMGPADRAWLDTVACYLNQPEVPLEEVARRAAASVASLNAVLSQGAMPVVNPSPEPNPSDGDDDEPIDWDLVASETRIMVDLNRSATEAFKQQQGQEP